ncbi:hypothetical protein HYV43_05280 [Candidatus Micrarchaeota archaeon]|nr:hypothetical protein [Candidatus Micrarchaeota archaeon]
MASESVEKQQFAHLRVDLTDGAKIRTGQFTLFDLVDRCFSFSQKRKRLAVQVLTLLSEKPRTFTALLSETRAQKSALHLALRALEQSGLIRQERRGAVFELSEEFAMGLWAYAVFWRNWKRRRTGEGMTGSDTCDMDDVAKDGQT